MSTDNPMRDVIEQMKATAQRKGKMQTTGGTKMNTQPYTHGECVYGIGTVKYLDGDFMEDGSGRQYHWPGYVCIEFDRPLENGEQVITWCQFHEMCKA